MNIVNGPACSSTRLTASRFVRVINRAQKILKLRLLNKIISNVRFKISLGFLDGSEFFVLHRQTGLHKMLLATLQYMRISAYMKICTETKVQAYKTANNMMRMTMMMQMMLPTTVTSSETCLFYVSS